MKQTIFLATLAALAIAVFAGAQWGGDAPTTTATTDAETTATPKATAVWATTLRRDSYGRAVYNRVTLALTVGTTYERGDIDWIGTTGPTCPAGKGEADIRHFSRTNENSVDLPGMIALAPTDDANSDLVGMPYENATDDFYIAVLCFKDGKIVSDVSAWSADIRATSAGALPAHCADYWRTSHCNDEHPDHATHRSRIADLESTVEALTNVLCWTIFASTGGPGEWRHNLHLFNRAPYDILPIGFTCGSGGNAAVVPAVPVSPPSDG